MFLLVGYSTQILYIPSYGQCYFTFTWIFHFGFNSILRRGCITYHEYLQVGKGRDVGLNQISKFEAKVANGNSEQTLSRDIYRLGHRFDFFRMLSCYFTTIGFYFSSLVTTLIPNMIFLWVNLSSFTNCFENKLHRTLSQKITIFIEHIVNK